MHPPSNINTTAALSAHFMQQMAQLPADDTPVFIEEFFPLSLNCAISTSDSLGHCIVATQPCARGCTAYYCQAARSPPPNPMLDAICKDWLDMVQAYAANSTAVVSASEGRARMEAGW